MDTARKITVEAPWALLEKARRVTGEGITQTVRTGLELAPASEDYARLRRLRGKVRFTRTWKELTDDRRSRRTRVRGSRTWKGNAGKTWL